MIATSIPGALGPDQNDSRVSGRSFLATPGCPVREKKFFVALSSGNCTRFHPPTTFFLHAPGARKRWYLRSWTTRTFRINFPRFMASFLLVPLTKRSISGPGPTKSNSKNAPHLSPGAAWRELLKKTTKSDSGGSQPEINLFAKGRS